MLKNRLAMILIVSCSLLGFLQADTPPKNHKPLKFRVEKSSVTVLKKGFSIVTKRGMIKTKTLRSDATGLYVPEKDLYAKKGEIDWPGYKNYYRCDTCHRVFEKDEVRKHVDKTGHKHFHYISDYH